MRDHIALAMTSLLVATIAIGGCDEGSATQDYGTPSGPNAPSAADSDLTVEAVVDPDRPRERSSTLGKAYGAAERTRDRVQERDAEIGEMADGVFEN